MEDLKKLNDEVIQKYLDYVNPSLVRLLSFMGYGTIEKKAEGCIVEDIFGKKFIDCLGGFGVFSLGHRNQGVIDAIKKQLDLIPLSSKVLLNKPMADLAEKLAKITPGTLKYSFFCNSGAEAVEGAIKIARLATGKSKIIYTQNSFHGKTLGALSVTGREKYRKPFEGLFKGVKGIPFNEPKALEEAIDDDTAGFIVEPIQAEGGVIIPSNSYLKEVEEICRKKKIAFIVDEIQTGLGRTGEMFACEHYGIEPDIMTLGKAIGGGIMPIGCFIAKEEYWKIFDENPLMHSSTFGGGELACAAAIAALENIEKENLPKKAKENGKFLKDELEKIWKDNQDIIVNVRGIGLLIGVEFKNEDVGGLVIAGLAERGLLVAYTLNTPEVIRIEPPLIIEKEELKTVIKIMNESINDAKKILDELKG